MGDVPVKVNTITIHPENPWARINSNQDFSAYSQFKMEIAGAGSVLLPKSDGSFNYSVAIPKNQPIAITNQKIATVTFTIAVDDTFPVTTEMQSSPHSITPILIKLSTNDYYYKIATFDSYTLLLSKELSEQSPSAPLFGVSVNQENDISLPSSGDSLFFDLSSTEYDNYCSNETYFDSHSPYQLRNNSFVVDNGTTSNYQNTSYHRYAIWVPTNSISTP